MDYLVDHIRRGVATNKLWSSKNSGNVYLTHMNVLDWALRKGFVRPQLVTIVKESRKNSRSLTGRNVESLQADKEILGAIVATLTEYIHEIYRRKISTTKIRELIEQNVAAFWGEENSVPKVSSGIERLIGPYQTNLRKYKEKENNNIDKKLRKTPSA